MIGKTPPPSRGTEAILPVSAKFGRYVLTAGTAAVVDLGGFAVLTGLGLAVFWGATASFLLANVVNYLLSARFAFGALPTWRRYPLFLAFSGLGLAINVAVTSLVVRAGWTEPLMAKLIGIGAAFSANFLMNLKVVFASR